MRAIVFALAVIAIAACSSGDDASDGAHGGAASSASGGKAAMGAGGTAGKAGDSASGGSAGRVGRAGTAGRDNAGSANGGAPNVAGKGGASNGGASNASNGGAGREAQGGEGATSGERSETGGACAVDGDHKTTLVFVNHCLTPVTFEGSDISGQTLPPGGEACVSIGSDTETLSAKRYWGYAGEDPGAEHHTLAEFTFNTDFNDFDWYNISHVDAFNLPMQIVPRDRPDCDTLSCSADFLADCPDEGKYRDDSGNVVACVSPERDDGSSAVAQYFESCDDAYAWSGDDQHGDDPSPVRACAGEDWDIVFCPGGDQ
ncbi:MAG TPA: thaumatin family protein [Polyangiaceae bacterium]|nr:thaumatin family protein [Polyangiaceae bacterium]